MSDADVAVRKWFSHIPAPESILNGAVQLHPCLDEAELQVIALKCVLILKSEYEKYSRINILVHSRLIEFSRLYVILPKILAKNIESILIDTYGECVLSYLTQTIKE